MFINKLAVCDIATGDVAPKQSELVLFDSHQLRRMIEPANQLEFYIQ